MTKLELVANRVYKRLPVKFDPTIIIVIISIITAVVKLYRACTELTPEELAKKYPILARLKIWWQTRRALKRNKLNTDDADIITDAIYEEFKLLSREDVNIILSEVN